MGQELYESNIEANIFFEFYSEGPNGRIKKVINFRLENADGKYYFSLTFGDWNENINKIDDMVVTDNKDMKKVLATVGKSVLHITEQYPDLFVHARGSTDSRTRLYQMCITIFWEDIDPFLHVFGYINNQWEKFRKNVNYEAFLVIRK
jgi:hypothetical protein